MAFATTSSAFGSGSGSNTGNPLFGSLGQQPQNQQGQQTTSLFGNPAGQIQQPTSLFGQPSTNTQPGAPQSGGGLFGQTNTQGAGVGTAPGLFGSNNTGGATWNTNNPLLPKSAFGASTPATNPGINTGTNTGTSLFGQPANTGTNTGATGLFGNNNNTNPGTGGTSLFGQQQPQQSTSLFGQPSQTQQQQGQPSMFGSAATGTSMFGQPQQQKPASMFGPTPISQTQSVQMSSPTGPPLFSKSTKFNDLPDNLKKTFEDIEAHIQGRVQISNDLKQRKVGEEASKGQDLIRGVHKDLLNAITTLQSDVLTTRDLKGKVEQTVQDTIVAAHIVDGFRNPQQHGAYLKNHANFPLEYFTRITEQMRERLQWYKTTIEQIERKLTSTAQQAHYTPQVIVTTLEAQNASFIALANKVAAIDTDLQRLKAVYTQLWRSRTGSMRDPFNELDRGAGGEFGVESLYVK
ncbi:hypothetical protein OF83DRAFT_1109880 [Amylostereum chailletii]|nr:hypothetical protein OF83DRAFT_1109880 [Amylostereum chailletii]